MGNKTPHQILEAQIKRAVEAGMAAYAKQCHPLPTPEKDSKDQIVAAVLTIACTLGPWGFSVPIVWACTMWGTAWFAFLYLLTTMLPYSKWRSPRLIPTCIFITAVAVAAVYSPIKAALMRERAFATSRPLITRRGKPTDPIMIQFCNANYVAVWNGKNKKEADLDLLSSKVRFTRSSNGDLLINTEIRDHDDSLIARIDDNIWTVPESMSWDKNYTNDALEVIDKRGRIVLQLRLYPDKIGICGEWWDDNGHGLRIADGAKFVPLSKDYNPIEPAIKPIFKYPSATHWAQWNN